MILGFKQKFPWEEPTNFREKILCNKKIHSIREGEGWKEGMRIHMAYGVRSKDYQQFNSDIGRLAFCTGVQKIVISPRCKMIMINGCGINQYTAELLAENDGFDSYEDFEKWFVKGLHGQIVHWTYYRY